MRLLDPNAGQGGADAPAGARMIQRVSVRFTGPGANQVVADLAAKAGITDLAGLGCALARAHAAMHIFDFGRRMGANIGWTAPAGFA